jgi:hypothetical protein
VTPVSGGTSSGVAPDPGVVVSGVAPVVGAAASGVAPSACVVTSGVVPDPGVAAFDKDLAPVAISEVAPITPHAFVLGTKIDDST